MQEKQQKTTTAEQSKAVEFSAIHGIRALLLLSVLLGHTAAFGTGFLASEGIVYQTIMTTAYASVSGMGFIQVDFFFIISGFLLCFSILNHYSEQKLSWKWFMTEFAKRYLRFATLYYPLLVYMLLFTDEFNWTSNTTAPLWKKVVVSMLFVKNNFADLMTMYDLHFWSVFADFQFSMVWCFLMMIIFQITLKDTRRVSLAVLLSCALTVYSLWVRAKSWDVELVNMTRANPHLASSRSCNTSEQYFKSIGMQFKQPTVCEDSHLVAMMTLYYPSLPRMASFTLGTLFGALTFSANLPTSNIEKSWWRIKRVLAVCISTAAFMFVGMLAAPKPLKPKLDVSVQWFATVFGHFIGASACAILLFSVNVPERHPFHVHWANRLLSMTLFRPISTASFTAFAIHMNVLRILMLQLMPPPMDYNQLIDPNSEDELKQRMREVFLYFLRVFSVLALVSISAGYLLHLLIEKPLLAAIKNILANKPKVKIS